MPRTPHTSREHLPPSAHDMAMPETAPPPAVWQSPDFTVVETALEVTAYALADR
nr:pyrroloquinoline quinone precursor peptide PqqA [Streptomyces sp. ISL-10]